MNILINYANELYRKPQKLNTWSGKSIARFDKIIEYSPEDIGKDFFEKNKEILSIPRGNGLWLWKPYFILKTLMEEAQENDVVFYCDAGAFFIRRIDYILLALEKQNIWFECITHIEREWTRREVFEILQCDRFKNSFQVQSGFIAVKKTARNIQFIETWLDYCCDIRLIGDNDSQGRPEADYFRAHREDQSIFSLLTKLYKWLPSPDVTQFFDQIAKHNSDYMAQFDNAPPPIVFILHRSKQCKPQVILPMLGAVLKQNFSWTTLCNTTRVFFHLLPDTLACLPEQICIGFRKLFSKSLDILGLKNFVKSFLKY